MRFSVGGFWIFSQRRTAWIYKARKYLLALWYLQKQNVFRGSYQFPRHGQNVQGARREGRGMLQMEIVYVLWGKGEQICSSLYYIQVVSQVS